MVCDQGLVGDLIIVQNVIYVVVDQIYFLVVYIYVDLDIRVVGVESWQCWYQNKVGQWIWYIYLQLFSGCYCCVGQVVFSIFYVCQQMDDVFVVDCVIGSYIEFVGGVME